VAGRLGITPLDDEVLQLGSSRAPLWYYVLAEAATLGTGSRLGPVGGTIVGEVVFAILAADPASFWRAGPTWTPFLGSAPERFTLPDLITYAWS
jgi:hypothetical protein